MYLLESYKGTEKIMGVILSAAYIVAKGSDILQRVKFLKRSFIKFLQKTVSLRNENQNKTFYQNKFLVIWNNSNEGTNSSCGRNLPHLPRQLPRRGDFERMQSYFLRALLARLVGSRKQHVPAVSI